MRVEIADGVKLYFDVDGLGLAPENQHLVERPTVILMHGGPGMDHATFKLGLTDLRDVAQVIVYDHRGHGRSDWRTSDEWNLDTWADDIVRFCDALEIRKPIVLGNSFGGMVAQHYIGRHPEHPGKVVLSSTAPRWDVGPVIDMFSQLGGPKARDAAKKMWSDPTPENSDHYRKICGPLYTQTPGNMFEAIATIRNPDVFLFWNSGENQTFDARPGLARAQCPVLVLAGELDPVCTMKASEEIVAALPPEHVQFERFANCGHGVFRDDPTRSMAILREFIARP